MSVVFSNVVADVAAEYVKKYPSEDECSSSLRQICGKTGVEFTLTADKTYRLAGTWGAMEKAYSMLVLLLEKYGDVTNVLPASRLISCVPSTDSLTADAKFSSRSETEATDSSSDRLRQSSLRQSPKTRRRRTSCTKRTTSRRAGIQSHENTHVPTDKSCRRGNRFRSMASKDESDRFSRDNREVDAIEDKPCDARDISGESSSDNEMQTEVVDESGTDDNKSELLPSKLRNRTSDLSVASRGIQTRYRGKKTKLSAKEKCSNDQNDSLNCGRQKSGGKEKHSVLVQHPCRDCDFVAESELSLNDHRRKNHLANPAVCDLCGKIFPNTRYMKRHQSSHVRPQHCCDLCGKVYKVRKSMVDHRKTHEDGYSKPTFSCKECHKSFGSSYILNCHVKSDHLGQRKTFLCSACGKSFTTKHSLQEHMNTHSGEKPYKCEICSKAFSYDSALRDHKFVHAEAKQFTCSVCSKSFSQRSGLKMHSLIHKDIKQFQCGECGRAFTQKQALQRHERVHKGDKPFTCKPCGRMFSDASIIRRHLILVHKIHKDPKTWREDITFSASDLGADSQAPQTASASSVDARFPGGASAIVQQKALNQAETVNLMNLGDTCQSRENRTSLYSCRVPEFTAAECESDMALSKGFPAPWMANLSASMLASTESDFEPSVHRPNSAFPLSESRETSENACPAQTPLGHSSFVDCGKLQSSLHLPTDRSLAAACSIPDSGSESLPKSLSGTQEREMPQPNGAMFQIGCEQVCGAEKERVGCGIFDQPWTSNPGFYPSLPSQLGVSLSLEQQTSCVGRLDSQSSSPSPAALCICTGQESP